MVIKIKKISDENLEKINGGGSAAIWIGLAITAITVFLSGIVDGVTNPKSCDCSQWTQ